jgi:hypothetical protein
MKVLLFFIFTLSYNHIYAQSKDEIVKYCNNNTFRSESLKYCTEGGKNKNVTFDELKYCNNNTYRPSTLKHCIGGAADPDVTFDELKYCNNNTYRPSSLKHCIEGAKSTEVTMEQLRYCNNNTFTSSSLEECLSAYYTTPPKEIFDGERTNNKDVEKETPTTNDSSSSQPSGAVKEL